MTSYAQGRMTSYARLAVPDGPLKIFGDLGKKAGDLTHKKRVVKPPSVPQRCTKTRLERGRIGRAQCLRGVGFWPGVIYIQSE